MSSKNEIHLKLFCKLCNKIYACPNSLCNHNKKFHKNPKDNIVIDITNNITNFNNNVNDKKIIKCEYCKKNLIIEVINVIMKKFVNLKII